MDEIRAYGSGMAGRGFDFNSFIRRQTVLLRIVALCGGFAQWISISKGGWMRPMDEIQEICLFNRSSSTCSFGSALGFFATIAAIALLILDAKFEAISSIQTRKRAVIADIATSGFFTFLFLIAFFNLWIKYASFELDEPYDSGLVKFAIFCALLSTVGWGGAAFFVWRKYEEGVRTEFATAYEQDFAASLGGPADYSYGESAESYQNPPLNSSNAIGSPIDIKEFQQGY